MYLALLILLTGLLALFYFWGEHSADDRSYQLEQLKLQLQERNEALEDQQQDYLHKITLLESARKIDKLALESIRGIVRGLEDEKAGLKKELAFYRNIIAPEDADPGVRVHTLDLLSGDDTGRFRFRLVVSQVSRSNPFLRGSLSVSITGLMNDEQKTLSLFKLAGLDNPSHPLGFRYFQSLPENRDYFDFELPDGFSPKLILVSVKIRSGSIQQLKEEFDWDKELSTSHQSELETELDI